MAANRKVDKTTTRSPSWQPIEKLITLPHDRLPLWLSGGSFFIFSIGGLDGDLVVVLSTFIWPAIMAIVW
jgi:hypothetical protein